MNANDYPIVRLRPTGAEGDPRPGLYYDLGPEIGFALCVGDTTTTGTYKTGTGRRFFFVGAGMKRYTAWCQSPMQGYELQAVG